MDNNEFLAIVTGGIKPKDFTPENVRETPTYSGVQLTDDQQKKADERQALADANIDTPTTVGETMEMQWDSFKDAVKSTDIYKNIFGSDAPDEDRLAKAEKLGNALGIAPQSLADNPKLYDTALIQYERQRNAAFLDNKPFTPKTVKDLYPELDMDDPVAVTMALKDSNSVLKGRTTIAAMGGLPSLIAGWGADEAAFLKDSWQAGKDIDEASEVKYSLYNGEISFEDARNRLEEIANRPEMRNEGRGINYAIGQTIRMNTQMARNIVKSAEEIISVLGPQAAQWINQLSMNAAAMGVAGTSAAAAGLGLTGAAASVPIGAAAAAAGIGIGTMAILSGTYRAQVGDNYFQYINEKNNDGTKAFTDKQARAMARRDAALQAVVETGITEYAYGAMGSVFAAAGRKTAAKEAIKNAAAMRTVVKAGTDAFKKAAKKAALKKAGSQFIKSAASEVAEEGIQSAISSIDERLSGYQGMTYKRMFDDAKEAMWQALPAVIGTMLPGSVIHGIGAYHGIGKISQADFDAARETMNRTSEKTMIDRLLEIRNNSKLFKNSPKTYEKTVQNQMDKANMGTIYIDAQAAAQNESTHEALNSLVSSGAVTAKELNQAITTGKPLEIKSGKYMQAATPETHEALSEYTTMDKGERTMHAIKEERQRNQDLVDLVRSSQKEREAKAGQAILDKYFSDTTTEEKKEDRDTMAELLSGGLSDLKTNTKNALDAALKDWGDLTGVKDIQDYMKGRKDLYDKNANEKGVDMVSLDRDTMIRISKNPGWYQDFYKSYGRAPNARELYDIAHRKMEDEVYYNLDKNDAEGMAEKETMEAAKKRVESIERVKDIVDKFDDGDIVAQSLLEPETYEQVYKPTVETLSQGNAAVKKSARDSALILSKMAENSHKNYGVPLKMAAVKINSENAGIKGYVQMTGENAKTAEDKLADDERDFAESIDKFQKGKIKEPLIRVMTTPLVMNLVNAPILPVYIRTKALNKILNGKHAYQLDADLLKQIPRALTDPVAIYSSDTQPGPDKIVVALDLKDKNDAHIVATFALNQSSNEVDGTHAYQLNFLTSVYGKDNNDKENPTPRDNWFLEQLEKGNLKYINRKKLQDFYGTDERLLARSSEKISELQSALIIKDENDLVKLKNRHTNFYQMAGERANTAMISRLQKAESMEKEDASPEEIWKETGWMRGPDHKWRFEIPDNLDKIDFPKDGKTHTLGEIYDNPALYEAYPELVQKTVRMEDTKSGKDKRTRGAYGYVAEDGSIVIDSSIPADEAKTALVHEIQHSIQAIEGFSRGGNKEMAKKYISDTIDRLSMDLMDMEFKDPKAKEYMDLAEEIADSFDENDIMGSLTKIKDLTEKRKKLLESLPEGERKELSIIERDLNLLEDAMKQDDYAAYRRLGGEAEAFMAEDRARNPSKSMPDYNTPFGPAVINYAGESLPFRTAEPDLVALHNLTVENLKKAIDLGGLAVPSVAITKKQTPYNFGSSDGVTLIMDKNVVDPTKTPVFSRDAWTKVFPSIVRTGDRKKITKFIEDTILPAQKEIPREVVDYGNLYTPSYPANHSEKNGELQEDVESFLHSDGAKYLYLKSVGKAPKLKMKKRGIPEELSKEPKLVKTLESLEKEYGSLDKLDDKGKEILNEVLKKPYEEKLKAKGVHFRRLIESALKRIESGDRAREVIYEFKKRNDLIPDKDAFISDLDKRAKGKPFEDWKESFRNEMLGESVIRDTGKPANLENITAAMIGGLKNAQKNMFGGYGGGNIIAASGKKLKSLDEFHKAEKNLNPETDIEAGMSKSEEFKKLKADVESFVDMVTPSYKWKETNPYDTIGEAYGVLVDYVKGKKLSSALSKHDFTETPGAEELAKRIKDQVKSLPAKYFEAKPQRAVYFNEVKGAVIPKNTPKEIKDYLRTQGVKIRLYDPKVEGQREEVTNKLQNQVNQYFQGEKYLGAYDRDTNAIEIFNGANQSTVIHEGAHMYLSMLEEYASLSPAEMARYFEGDESKATASLQKMTADLKTIREWAAYTGDHLKEYEGTSLEKEFKKYGEDIENGVEGAEERFMQERFARGFEKYLMEGSAPTKELKGVFRRFKSWLKDIYSAAKNLGSVKLTPEIKDIYDHMLATDREVEAWAAQRKLDSIDKALNVNASEAENLKKWSEEVKEKAKEIALSYYMKTMKSDALDSFQKSIDTPEAKDEFARKLAEENPFFKIEQILHSGQLPTQSDKENFLKMNNYDSEKEFNEAVEMMGGTTEEQYRKHIDSEIRNFKGTVLTEEDVRAMAENVLESPEGLQKRANLEAALLEKRVNQYINEITTSQLKLKRASDKAKAAAEIRERLGLVTPEDKAEMGRQTERIAKNEEKISKLEDQVKKLKDQLAKEKEKTKAESKEKFSAQEEVKRLEGNLQAREKELEEERQKNQKTSDTLKDTEFNVAELSVQLSDMVEGLKESRRAMKTDYKLMKDEAASTLGEETISHATSWKWWENKARTANARAMKAASQNNWEESAYQKNVEAQCLVMARTAKDNIEEIKRDLHGGGKLTTQQYNEEGMDRYGVLGIINRIGRKENPVFVNGDARYFVQHLAYMAGITKVDGPKPIDENGMYRDFDWHALGLECNPELGIYDAKYKGRDVIPSWMMAMFESRDPMRFMDLTMNKYRDIITAIKVVYHIGRREQVGNTLGTSFDFAAAEIQNEVMDRWKGRAATPFDKEISSTRLTRTGEKFHKLVRDITLPEIQIERLGKAAYKYIYLPIDRATAKRRQMKQDANKRFREIFDLYSRKEWTRMRSKKEFEYGTDPSGAKRLYTKEQVLSMALNMGTQSNMARLIETVGGNEVEMLNFLDSVMDKRDWEFVTKIWEHIGEYWGERNKIQDHLYGTPMGKVPGLKFTLKSGQVIHGQYYPIKYDHKTSSRSNEYSANDIASMDLQGISAFSLGMGSTKTRENGSGGQMLRLDLDVYVSHISEAIQHVAMREATVDVFKLLSRKEVVSSLERTIGTEATNELRQWVSDNWHSSIIEMNEWEKGVNRLRHKFVFATMGYRLSTAILNVLNIFGMMERMGTYNALKATSDFYFRGGANKFRNIKEQYQFIISKSTFMRERAATMDRDMTMGDRIQVGQNEWEWSSKVRHGKYGIDTINSGAFKIIALTDEMFSLPEWLATYKGALAKMQAENKLTAEEMDREAVRLADKAVRETFGSGEMKDQTSFMRKGGNIAGLTTFFSYTNLVTNQFIRAGYALYDYHTTKPLLRATFFWWVLNSFFETCLREMWDDSDDPDKWKKKLLYTFASGGPLGGIPILRDILPPTVNFITKGGKGPLLDITPDVPAFDSVKYFGKTLQSLYKGDAIETGRNFSKGLTRVTSYTLPDTLVDGYWNFMRMISSDNLTLTDWIYKSMFDKPLKEKK